MVRIQDIREGSVVIVRGCFGQGKPETVVVDEVDTDIKNGIPGIGYGDSWAYITQVDRVVTY